MEQYFDKLAYDFLPVSKEDQERLVMAFLLETDHFWITIFNKLVEVKEQ